MPISCPRCDTEMEVHRAQPQGALRPVDVDICGRCGGLWLDHGEAAVACPTVAHLERRHIEIVTLGHEGGGLARCPRCAQTPYMFQLIDIELDYCPGCKGVWLDAHEHQDKTKLEYDPDVSGIGPYRAVQRAATTEYADCAGCDHRERPGKMFMSASGLVCRKCYAKVLARQQQRRIDDAGGEPTFIDELLSDLVNLLDQQHQRSYSR